MKTIIIIGAGMGGLAAGIYGQANGFKTTIFEAHSLPGELKLTFEWVLNGGE